MPFKVDYSYRQVAKIFAVVVHLEFLCSTKCYFVALGQSAILNCS